MEICTNVAVFDIQAQTIQVQEIFSQLHTMVHDQGQVVGMHLHLHLRPLAHFTVFLLIVQVFEK